MSYRGQRINLEREGHIIRDATLEAEDKPWEKRMWTLSDERFESPWRGWRTMLLSRSEASRSAQTERMDWRTSGNGCWSGRLHIRTGRRCIEVGRGRSWRRRRIRFRNGFLQDRNVFVIQGPIQIHRCTSTPRELVCKVSCQAQHIFRHSCILWHFRHHSRRFCRDHIS